MKPANLLPALGLLVAGLAVGVVLGAVTDDSDAPGGDATPVVTTTEPPSTDGPARSELTIAEPLYVGPPLDEAALAALVGTRQPTPDELAAAQDAGVELPEPRPAGLPEPMILGTTTRPAVPDLPDDAPDPADACASDDAGCRADLDRTLAAEEESIARTGGPPVEGDDVPPACETAEDPEECARLFERRLRLVEDLVEGELETSDGEERPAEETYEDSCVERAVPPGEVVEEMPDERSEPGAPGETSELEERVADGCVGIPGTIDLGGGEPSVGVLPPVMNPTHHPVCGDAPELEPLGSSLLFATSHPVRIEGRAVPFADDATPTDDAVGIAGETTVAEPIPVPAAVLDPGSDHDVTSPVWVTCLPVAPAPIETTYWGIEVQLVADGLLPRSLGIDVLAPPLTTLEGDGAGDTSFFFPTLDLSGLGIYIDQLTAPDRRVIVTPRTRRALTVDVDVDDDEKASVLFRLRPSSRELGSACGGSPQDGDVRFPAEPHPATPAPREPFDRMVRAEVQNRYADDTGRRGDLCITIRTDATPSSVVARYEVPVYLPDPPTYEVSAGGVFPLPGADVPTSLALDARTYDSRCSADRGIVVADHLERSDVFGAQCTISTAASTFDVTTFPRWAEFGAELATLRFGFPADPPRCPATGPCEVLQRVDYNAARSDTVAGQVLVRIRRIEPGTTPTWTIGSPVATSVGTPERPGIRPGQLTITRSADDPARTLVVEGVADRPVEARATAVFVPSTRSPLPCTRDGAQWVDGASDPADPRRFRVVIDRLCPGTAYSISVSVESDGVSSTVSSSRDFTDSTDQRGLATTATLRVPVTVTVDFDSDAIGTEDGFIPYSYGVQRGEDWLFAVRHSFPREARFELPCDSPDTFDTEVVTEIELGAADFEGWAGARTWRGGCPDVIDQLTGARNFGRDYQDHVPGTSRQAPSINAFLRLLEGGEEIRMVFTDHSRNLETGVWYPRVDFATITIGPAA